MHADEADELHTQWMEQYDGWDWTFAHRLHRIRQAAAMGHSGCTLHLSNDEADKLRELGYDLSLIDMGMYVVRWLGAFDERLDAAERLAVTEMRPNVDIDGYEWEDAFGHVPLWRRADSKFMGRVARRDGWPGWAAFIGTAVDWENPMGVYRTMLAAQVALLERVKASDG